MAQASGLGAATTGDTKGAQPRARPRARVWLGIVLLLLVGGGAYFFPRAGHFVVAQDSFAHADVGLILSGEPVTRALAARDLYRAGRIDRVVVIPEPPDPNAGELIKLGLLDPSLPPLSARILRASGVPTDRIAFLPEPADGTITEAQRVRQFFGESAPRRLAVITSKFASRRACFIFRRVVQDVEIVCSPTPYDTYEPNGWWRQPRRALMVVMEYEKFIVNASALMFGFAR